MKAQLRMDIVSKSAAIADEVYACVRSGRDADLGVLGRFVESTVLSGPGPAALAAYAPHPLDPAAAYEASTEAHDFAPALAALTLLDTDFDIYHGATDPGDAPASVVAPAEVRVDDEEDWSERRRLLEAELAHRLDQSQVEAERGERGGRWSLRGRLRGAGRLRGHGLRGRRGKARDVRADDDFLRSPLLLVVRNSFLTLSLIHI